MSPQEWLKILKTAYFEGFIRRGGSTVKFAVVEDTQDSKAVVQGVSEIGQEEGYVTIHADARQTKVQLIDLLFQEMARQIDWSGLAFEFVRKLFLDNDRKIPEQQEECG